MKKLIMPLTILLSFSALANSQADSQALKDMRFNIKPNMMLAQEDSYSRMAKEYVALSEKYKDIVIGDSEESTRAASIFFEKYIKNSEERPQDFKVLGLSRKSALFLSNSRSDYFIENDDPCSALHNQGDISNKWCHAGFSKVAYAVAKENGLGEFLSQGAGLLVFVIKEFGDKNYDFSDINTAPIGGKIGQNTEVYTTFMLDGATYFEFLTRF
ncbi:hypothetical protein ACRXCV_04480 [Halobacteriovorax sp. GFR7]|uniref:hypothetical protein n=1 Tax=unclassified Halobacteriovorax TaxID=2639665 RepID=UPI003D98A667